MKRVEFCVILLALLVFPTSSDAQFSSNIQGTVQDQTAAAIPNAKVQVRNLETQIVLNTTTNEAGFYRFNSLPPGRYEVSGEASGFQPGKGAITLLTAQTADVSLTLPVAGRVEHIEVTAQARPIDVADSRIQATLQQSEVKDLPLQGRNFLGLTVLAPGVTGVGGTSGGNPGDAPDNFSTEKSVAANANGQSSNGNFYTLDGLNITSNVRPGVLNLSPNPESVQEVSIQTNTFSVEQGVANSLAVAITTKSGANDFHGSAAWFYTDRNLWARSEFTSKYEPFHKHDIAGGVGGPILKNRTFFFAAIEPLRSSFSGSTALRTFEAPEFVNWAKGVFPNSLGTDLLSKYPATNVAVTGVASTAQDIFGAECGTPATFNIPCTLPMVDQGSFKPSPYRNGLQYSLRIDHNFNQNRDRLYGNFYRTGLESQNITVRPSFESTNQYHTRAFQFNETHTFSGRLLNEASFGFYRVRGTNVVSGPFSIPEIYVGWQNSGLGVGWGPGTFTQHNYNWRDVVTLVRGTHTLKFGYEGWHGDDDVIQAGGFYGVYSRPTFYFPTLLDLVQDSAYSESGVSFDPLTGLQKADVYTYLQTRHAAFVQDEWKARPGLTLTMGIRWDDFGNAYPAQGSHLGNLFLGSGATMDERIADASVKAVDHVFPHSLNRNFSPRFGVAWEPTRTGRWVVRGGIGIFRNWMDLGFQESGIRTNPPGFIFPTLLRGTSLEPLFSLGTSDTISGSSNPFGYTFPTIPVTAFDSHGGIVGTRIDVGGVDRGYTEPATYIYTAGVEHELGRGLVAGVNYSGSHVVGSLQVADTVNANVIDMNRIAGDLLDGTLDRLNPSFGRVMYAYGWNTINYNALILTLRRRAGAKGMFQASYTLSHNTDYGTDFPDQHKIPDYRGDSNSDVRNRFSFSGIYNLPSFSQTPPVVQRVFGGWQLASTLILQSGYPFTVYTSAPFSAGGDYNADGYNYDFSNTPTQDFTGGHSRQDYLRGLFTSADFPVPTPGTEGNLKRNLYRGPGFANVDFGLIKNNRIKERTNIQVRVESFNLFNRVNLQGVNSDLTSGMFGRSTSTYNPRTIQLGLRAEF